MSTDSPLSEQIFRRFQRWTTRLKENEAGQFWDDIEWLRMSARSEISQTNAADAEVTSHAGVTSGPATAAPSDDKSETLEQWQKGLLQRPQHCACLFEWRPMPDFSGAPPVQLEECGFHAEQRSKLERELNAARSAKGASGPVRIVGIITFDWIMRVARQESMKYLEGTESPEDVVRLVLDAVQELSSSDSGRTE